LETAPPSGSSTQKCGMKHDVSWHKSAARYAGIYKSLAGGGSA
jgi:glycogen synthase